MTLVHDVRDGLIYEVLEVDTLGNVKVKHPNSGMGFWTLIVDPYGDFNHVVLTV